MDHTPVLGTEPSSIILYETKKCKTLKSDAKIMPSKFKPIRMVE